ncbi:ABC transporter substrate-binding protein [Salipaludibacillus aurantiacus]|uniref:Cellobiose transport system substrate-binding protein n=1 Tax=Salipaludibacillus aurantiacus TaxID=1601833 RepID=A0A1H9V1N3_9BACI|nr:extracellular solute-binding protein [Salipaludibacillus aurantiacus]SES15700.1 cellobiose transport system substrate-binding protein [Salipaludibacillus aurantiacus]
MKRLSVLSVILVSSLIVTGCNSNNEGNDGNISDEGNEAGENNITSIGEDDAEIELSFWLFGANYDSLVEEYVENNPEISINIQQIDMADHHNNLFTSLSAGSGAPDMAAIEVSEIDSYKNAEDQFINLYDLGAAYIEDDYLDWVWDIGSSVDGDFLFGIPTDIGPTVMYYRTDVFEEAGLPTDPDEVEELIQTWEDYGDAAQTILDETGKAMSDNPEMVYNAKRDQAPEQYFNEDDELIIETSPYVKQAYFDTVDWIEKGYIKNLGMWTPEWGSGMQEGNYATLLGPAWMRDTIKENAPDETNWRIAQMPEGAGNWGGSWVTIPAQTEHPEEAYEFLTWLLAPEQQLRSFEERGMFPSTPSVYDNSDFVNTTDDFYGGQNVGEIFAEAALDVEHVYKGPYYGDVNAEIVNGLDNVYDGADPDEEWDDITTRVEQRISR